jgi:GABA(A) receptor-associated protein
MKKSLERFFNDKLKPKPRSFRDNFPFQKRLNESIIIREKYPNRIPIICEKWGNDTEIPNIDRKKYLVPNDLSVANFMYVVRKRLKLSSDKGIYLFINDKVMPTTSASLSQYYESHKDEDGFLYISYSGESTFG